MPAPPVRHPATPSPVHDHIQPPPGDWFRSVASRPFNPRERHAGLGAIGSQPVRLTANSPRPAVTDTGASLIVENSYHWALFFWPRSSSDAAGVRPHHRPDHSIKPEACSRCPRAPSRRRCLLELPEGLGRRDKGQSERHRPSRDQGLRQRPYLVLGLSAQPVPLRRGLVHRPAQPCGVRGLDREHLPVRECGLNLCLGHPTHEGPYPAGSQGQH